jgi:cytoplasmic iron level regulating protein YaaA (DUF328/UPF0246 family)
MLIVISPAKRLDEQSKKFGSHTTARNADKTRELIAELQKYSAADLQKLMSINPKLADLNVERFQRFKKRHSQQNSLQALFAFNGDVFLGLDAKSLDDEAVLFAQDHLRILSGLYGVLRPLDLIQAYRLEMGTNLVIDGHKDLYSFWDHKITNQVKADMRASKSDVLLNLASQEYFKSIDTSKIKKRILSATFKEYRDGKLKFFSVFGKKARGLMARYVIENRISDPEQLKGFNLENYYYEESLSTRDEFVFVR